MRRNSKKYPKPIKYSKTQSKDNYMIQILLILNKLVKHTLQMTWIQNLTNTIATKRNFIKINGTPTKNPIMKQFTKNKHINMWTN